MNSEEKKPLDPQQDAAASENKKGIELKPGQTFYEFFQSIPEDKSRIGQSFVVSSSGFLAALKKWHEEKKSSKK
jgi:hypothetical protein